MAFLSSGAALLLVVLVLSSAVGNWGAPLAAYTVGTGAPLSPANELPPIVATSEGSAIFTLYQPSAALDTVYVAFVLTQSGIANIVAAHIHQGGPTANGPVVVSLVPYINFTDFQSSGRAAGLFAANITNVTRGIVADPPAYYVNYHTVLYPNGAMRAQLAASSTTIMLQNYTYESELSSVNVVNVSANSPLYTGNGLFSLTPSTSGNVSVYFEFEVSSNLNDMLLAHIHMGNIGVAGPIVIDFTPAINFAQFNALGVANGTATTDLATYNAIIANPSGYYAQIHTMTYPNGALRNQLNSSGIGFLASPPVTTPVSPPPVALSPPPASPPPSAAPAGPSSIAGVLMSLVLIIALHSL